MLTIRNCGFRLASPEEKVLLVVARNDSVRFAPLRYLIADYDRGDCAARKPVLLTFMRRDDAEKALKRVSSFESRYVCSMPLKEASWISFNRLQMDLVVVYEMDECKDMWQLFYGKRGSSFFDY